MERSMFVCGFIGVVFGLAIVYTGLNAVYYSDLYSLILMLLLIIAFALDCICTYSETVRIYKNEHHYENADTH